MRRLVAAAFGIALIGAACSSGGSGERVVRVDYQHDEFASHYWRYFPSTVYAHPGDTVAFKQEWTGEPHTVTLGTRLDELSEEIAELESRFPEDPTPEQEAEGQRSYERMTEGIVFDPYLDADAPLAARPCYLRSGQPPRDESCPERTQPSFDGRFSYYSSGFIPPSGPSGNTYRVPLSEDISPGTYNFHCVIHYGYMQGRMVVKPSTEELPSAAEMDREALEEIASAASPLRRALAEVRAGRATTDGERIRGPIAGYHAGDEFTLALDEFVPKRISAKVGEAITWTVIGAHTVSFDVPRFVPVYTVEDDGSVKRNPVVDRAAGGSPDPPPADFSTGPSIIDGGTWDGSGFFSSGLLASEPFTKYTLRVSKPGEYFFACLVHPAMVGTLVVRN
jgi:plastocyanin